MDIPNLLKGFFVALIISTTYLLVPVQASADDIFRGFIPCTKNGKCENKAGDKSDDEVGQIGAGIPENSGDDVDLIDVTPQEPPPPPDDEEIVEENSSLCEVPTQPALDNVFVPEAQGIDNTVKDCKLWGCRGGNLVFKPKDDDITEEAKKCNKCAEGNLTPQSGTCEDGLFCTSATGTDIGPDMCVLGNCAGKPIGPKSLVEGSVEFNVSALVEALKSGGETLNAVCQLPKLEWSGAIKQSLVDECCESKQSLVRGAAFEGEVIFTGAGVQCNLPAASWPPIVIGVTGGLEIGGSVKGTGISTPCAENCNGGVTGTFGITINGGLYAAVINPNVLSVSGTIAGSGNVEVKKFCDNPIEVTGCVGPPSVNGSVTAGGWYRKKVSFTPQALEKWRYCWF